MRELSFEFEGAHIDTAVSVSEPYLFGADRDGNRGIKRRDIDIGKVLINGIDENKVDMDLYDLEFFERMYNEIERRAGE